jgi:hypothetical protein
MNKQEKENPIKMATMTNTFVKNCKSDIAKFGFGGKEYAQFLISVRAMKDENTVLKYPNSELSEYREKYLKKNEYGIGDSLILDKYKIKSSYDNGKKYETGYFAPRSFWDKILETNLTS